jgi:hypothetical protein
MADSYKKKNRPFVATHAMTRKAPAFTASIKADPKLRSFRWHHGGRRFTR